MLDTKTWTSWTHKLWSYNFQFTTSASPWNKSSSLDHTPTCMFPVKDKNPRIWHFSLCSRMHVLRVTKSQGQNAPFTYNSTAVPLRTPEPKSSQPMPTTKTAGFPKLSPPWTVTLESSQQTWPRIWKTLPRPKFRQFQEGANTNQEREQNYRN